MQTLPAEMLSGLLQASQVSSALAQGVGIPDGSVLPRWSCEGLCGSRSRAGLGLLSAEPRQSCSPSALKRCQPPGRAGKPESSAFELLGEAPTGVLVEFIHRLPNWSLAWEPGEKELEENEKGGEGKGREESEVLCGS